MAVLRRVLYAQAAIAAVLGVVLAAVPRLFLETLFDQVPLPEYAWVRLVGIQLLATAMFSVLVAQRVEDLWFWGWAFAIPAALAFLVFGATAAVGLECAEVNGVAHCPGALLWWILAAIAGALSAGFVLALARASQDAPPP